jgi:hypothetical protein
MEEDEEPLLEAVITKRLVKTLQTGEDLAYAVLICKFCKSAIVLFVATTCKWSVDPIIQNPVYSHSLLRDNILLVI